MSDPFDFEAFIAGTKLPTLTVPLYRVDHSRQIADLDAKIKALPEQPGDEREGQVSQRDTLTAERDRLSDEQAASATEFELRALSATEYRVIIDDDGKDVFDQIAAMSQGTRNEAPRETWERVAGTVSAMQWGEFVTRANALVLSKVVVPDFSQQPSTTTPASSASSEPADPTA